jgi:protein-arginine kinase activator protein McsA
MTHVSQHQAVIYNTNPRQQHFLSMLKKIKEEIFCQLHRITYKMIAKCKKNGVVLCYIVTYESVIIDTGIFKITFVPFD